MESEQAKKGDSVSSGNEITHDKIKPEMMIASKDIADHLMEDVLPTIKHEDAMLVLVGTLTIMRNRMNYNDMGAAYRDQLKRGDVYYD